MYPISDLNLAVITQTGADVALSIRVVSDLALQIIVGGIAIASAAG